MEQKQTLEEGFRESLEELVILAGVLGTHFETVEELVASIKHALENDVHLKLLMSLVAKSKKR